MYWWSLLRQSKQCCCEQRGGHASCITLWPRGRGLCSPLNGNCSPRATTKSRTNFGACWRGMAASRAVPRGRRGSPSLRPATLPPETPSRCLGPSHFFLPFSFFFTLSLLPPRRPFPREGMLGEGKSAKFLFLLREKRRGSCSIELRPPRSELHLKVLPFSFRLQGNMMLCPIRLYSSPFA